ncbi:hypothetical protein QWY84_12870 [Aquisalimonas lutea]|uniref:hypothetical protein n=1 Tax=Aquisalimonas lutea TaxID=1327750 RepID=UPI0025B3597D|nr:hypothetical protein [Aquisalimonas lutea]MDN3518507.1 hypothetical protein [Aquisalimonas lutea]
MGVSEEMQLLHFPEQQLLLSDEEAKAILMFFFEGRDFQYRLETVSLELVHRELAQALLVEAIDGTYEKGFVDDLFMSVATGFHGGVKRIVQKFAKKALNRWFDHANLDSLWGDVEIYESVRVTIARSHRSTAEVLVNGDVADY